MKTTLLNSALLAITLSLSAFGGVSPTPALAQETAPAAVPLRDVDPALWVVKDEDTTVYLFGTVHILKPGLGWFDEAVKSAFEKSDTLVLEMVQPPADQTQALFTKYGIDKSGKSLRSKLSDAERADYDAAMAKIGMPKEAFDPLKPWAGAVTIQVIGLSKSGYDVNSGVETQLTAAAKAANKPISGVETMESQLAIFDGLPEATQIRFLAETAKMADETSAMMDKMVDLWAKPDPQGLAQLMNEGLSDPAIMNALLVKRNADWARWIDARMEKPGTVFMAVGAGHLAGSTSVQALLPAYGLQAERVEY